MAYIEPVEYNRLKISLHYRTIFGHITYTYMTQEFFTSPDWARDPFWQHFYIIRSKHYEGNGKFYYYDDFNSAPLKWTSSDEGVIQWLKDEMNILTDIWVKQGWEIVKTESRPDPPDDSYEQENHIYLSLADSEQIIVPVLPQVYREHLKDIAKANYETMYKSEISQIRHGRNVGVRHESVWDDNRLVSETVYLMGDTNRKDTVTTHDQIYLTRFHDGSTTYHLYPYLVEDAVGIGDTLPTVLHHPDDKSAYHLYARGQELRDRVETLGWQFNEKTYTETTNIKGHTVKQTTYQYRKIDDPS